MAISSGQLVWPAGVDAPRLESWLAGLLAAGVEAVQVREKHLDDSALFHLVHHLVERLGDACRVLVNGRADVALAARAHGVHLPADGLPAEPLRRRCGPDFLIGRSTHSPADAARAREERCDYAVFGPIWPTPSKAEREDLPGFDGLAAACREGLPLLALGGITTVDDVEHVARLGARGIAAIRAFQSPEDAARLAAAAHRCFSAANTSAEPAL